MKRRQFLTWVTRTAGAYFGLAAAGSAVPHLLRINSVRLGEANAHVPEPCVCEASDDCLCEGSDFTEPCPTDGNDDPCSPDTCTTQDGCGAGDSTGNQCRVSDTCDRDVSWDCRVDTCQDDSSGDCVQDSCTADSSGGCTSDQCASDSSGGCLADDCSASDSSGACVSDSCTDDSAGACVADNCTSDSSGNCMSDQCTSDSSGYGKKDACDSDNSGACRNDNCTTADNSGACLSDACAGDSSGGCTADRCKADSSDVCVGDTCTSDSSGECTSDSCTEDVCTVSDSCLVGDTSTGTCAVDHCGTDASGSCSSADVCVKDSSASCTTDLCRQDAGGGCSTRDSCALDLTPLVNTQSTGLNRALRWLYRISVLLLAFNLQPDDAFAATVIDASDAVFFSAPYFTTSAELPGVNASGAFLRDCDHDGIDEADTNGDGACDGDPELRDYNDDGSRELPQGTTFAGSFQFRCFYLPSDVSLVTSGAVSIAVAEEAAVFGSVDAGGNFTIDAPGRIDLRTSAWMVPAVNSLSFRSATEGTVDQVQNGFPDDVLEIDFDSACPVVARGVSLVSPILLLLLDN